MKVSDFKFDLPDHLIAQFPSEERSDSRLLCVDADGALSDRKFVDIIEFINQGDLLVLNNTKVIPARLFAKKETGGKLEILIERVTAERRFIAQIRSSKSPKAGQKIYVDGDGDGNSYLSVRGREGIFFDLELHGEDSLSDWLEKVGHIPLPPYIDRQDQSEDANRYQTVYADKKGAVAAPTAGLHYDQSLLEKLANKGVEIAYVTLHVGAGTYQPVRVDQIQDHQMHKEWLEVSQDLCDKVLKTKKNNRRVIAVGTTVVRSLETAARAAKQDLIEVYNGDTDIFIYPGFDFKIVDVLQTNFHLSESTLLMLVSAFSGKETILNAYRHAVEQEYRFFSYGDAMLLEKAR